MVDESFLWAFHRSQAGSGRLVRSSSAYIYVVRALIHCNPVITVKEGAKEREKG